MRSILCFVIIVVSLNVVSSEELETRKTVKKAAPISAFNDPRARADEIELESVSGELAVKDENNEVSPASESMTEKVTEATTTTTTTTTVATPVEVTQTTQKPEEPSTTEKLPETSNESSESNEDDDSHEAPNSNPNPPNINNILPPTLNPKRKVLYVNQQQNGKLNVHLELSDVSVIVIPHQKDPQLSLLNLLLKSAQKSNARNEAKKKEENLKSVENHHEEYSKYKLPAHPNDESFVIDSGNVPRIESRAPYKVDISSISGSQSPQSQPLVDISPNSHHTEHHLSARSPIMHLLKPVPVVIQPGLAHSPQKHRVFRRSIDSRLLGIDDEMPKEEELTESSSNTVDNDDEFNVVDTSEESEFVLLGATENCGPGRKRNSYQICVSVQD